MRNQFLATGLALFSQVIFHISPRAEETPAAPVRLELLRDMPLEDLLRRPVTTVSRKPEEWFKAPAAVYVISGDEIRRSGVRTIPDALRLAPGMEVGRLSGNQWAVSTRGFNARFNSTLLVLIDGRAVYQPVFGGVYWDQQDTLLEDIDRIEVVRGPGGTLWGANAVNGVVNIVTKEAKETVGGLVTAGYGTPEYFTGGRYGFKAGDHGFIRGYAKYDNFDELKLDQGDARDGWDRFTTGARGDWNVDANHFTLQGDYYYENVANDIYYPTYTAPYGKLINENYYVQGGNVLGRWVHTFSEDNDLQLQSYWDHSARHPVNFDYKIDTFDIDFQQRFALPWRQQLIYGGGYRLQSDLSRNRTNVFQFDPASRDFQLFSAFIQDEIGLVEDKLNLTLGTKVEHNDFSGLEYIPNVRLAYYPTEKQTVWTSFSRAIRSPSRASHDLRANLPLSAGIFRFTGDPSSVSEKLMAAEIGYRIQPVKKLSLDLTGYYFVFDSMESLAIGTPFLEVTPGPPHVVVPATQANEGVAHTYGFELASEFEATDWWRLRAGFNLFRFRRQEKVTFDNSATPKHQFFVRSSMDLIGDKVALDLWLRYRDKLELYNLPNYTDLDVRLAWRPVKDLELAVVGQNLFYSQRRDFGTTPQTVSTPISELPRAVYGQVTYRF